MNFRNVKTIDELLKKASEEITDEMREFFNKRTTKHIDLVKKYCKLIHEYDPNRFKDIVSMGEVHDDSKWKEPEVTPYIYITWDYRCKDTGDKFDISDEQRNKMDEASNHHVNNNSHHPECHDSSGAALINRKDRDAIPNKMVDATSMPDLAIAEMCADWCSMSEEKGNIPKEWADKNINKRWKFSDEQVDLIYELIGVIWA